LSYKEAAAKLNVPIGTISTRLMRARERLKALLTEET
jgi:DNA-directed RNA polymerase specialized sigma24 family protein